MKEERPGWEIAEETFSANRNVGLKGLHFSSFADEVIGWLWLEVEPRFQSANEQEF